MPHTGHQAAQVGPCIVCGTSSPARRPFFCVRPQRPPDPFNTCFFFFFFSKPSHCDGSQITNQLSKDLHGAWCL